MASKDGEKTGDSTNVPEATGSTHASSARKLVTNPGVNMEKRWQREGKTCILGKQEQKWKPG